MESSPAKQEIRDESAAVAAAGGGGVVVLGAQRQPIGLALVVRRRLQAAALFLFWGFMGALGALRQLIEVLNLLQAAVMFLFQGCSRGVGTLRQLIEPEDRRLQAAAFLLAIGGCTVLNGTAMNRSVNPEHLLAGLFMFSIGAAMAILTLAGGGAGRAADRLERLLRGLF